MAKFASAIERYPKTAKDNRSKASAWGLAWLLLVAELADSWVVVHPSLTKIVQLPD
jgi:hypothetical protein